jgi:hypothetical protein
MGNATRGISDWSGSINSETLRTGLRPINQQTTLVLLKSDKSLLASIKSTNNAINRF